MAFHSLIERGNTFNQSSLSSREAFQLSDRIDQLKLSAMLLEKVDALLAIAIESTSKAITERQKKYYLLSVRELAEAAANQLSDVLDALSPNETDAA